MKWTYSSISELFELYEETDGNISKIAELMEVPKVSVENAIYRYIKKNSSHYRRRKNTRAFRMSHGGM